MSSSMPKVSPTESFLRYLTLPEDESEFVELQHCAVVLVSHLDRLAAPYLPASSNQKVQPCTQAVKSSILHVSTFPFLFSPLLVKRSSEDSSIQQIVIDTCAIQH